jgi:hypothetical protein
MEPIMAELRSGDPRSLITDPNNPRRTTTPKVMDDQLVASIQAIGMIQPPLVKKTEARLGNRDRQPAQQCALRSARTFSMYSLATPTRLQAPCARFRETRAHVDEQCHHLASHRSA